MIEAVTFREMSTVLKNMLKCRYLEPVFENMVEPHLDIVGELPPGAQCEHQLIRK